MRHQEKRYLIVNKYVSFLFLTGIIIILSGCATPKILKERGEVPPPVLAPVENELPQTITEEPAVEVPFLPNQQISITEQQLPVIESFSDFPKIEPKEIQYKVQKGDSFWSISKKYGVGMKELATYNNMDITKPLKAGTTISIPPGGKLTTDIPILKDEEVLVVTAKPLATAQPSVKKQITIIPATKSIPSVASTIKPSVGNNTYIVQSGDSLWLISRKYGTSVQSIADTNNISKNSVLKVGQKLNIPSTATSGTSVQSSQAVTSDPNKLSKEDTDLINDLINSSNTGKSSTNTISTSQSINYLPHTVKDGDTWNTISEMYGVSINNLKKANSKFASNANLTPGIVINIPEE